MVARRTVDLLPEIFRTGTNKQFLNATLDQLTQEPSIKRTQGFVGRRVGPGVNPADQYVTEPTKTRQDYQLEPGVVFFKEDTNRALDAITYPGMVDALALNGAITQRQDRLFEEQYYAWDPFVDLDKFVNYSQYYWLPQGPDSVDVSKAVYPTTDSWDITRIDSNGIDAYRFSDVEGNNPTLTLVRGGNYTFNVNQLGFPFWIQAYPGVDGTMPATPNISSRDVLGVENNGDDVGEIRFNVPLKTAQDFYYTLTNIGTVDLVSTDIKFIELNNVYVDQFLSQYPDGIDGITNLNGRTIIFTSRTTDAEAGGWQVTTQYDPLQQGVDYNGLIGSYDTTEFDQITDLTVQERYSIWRIQYIFDGGTRPYMRLSPVQIVDNLSKFSINFGTQWASTSWYKDAEGYFDKVPLLTAGLDTLWYQDANNPLMFGRLQLVDPAQDEPLNINDIIGARAYTSPNGVVFTNGLKVQFRGAIEPAEYQDLEYYVEGVGSGPGIDLRVGFVDGQAYFGPYHVLLGGQKRTGLANSGTFQQNIYDTVEESLVNIGRGGPDGAPLPTQGVANALLENGIRLIPVSDLVTPETYTKSVTIPYDSTPYDSDPFDEALNAPLIKDYLTINRSAADRNAWSRSNRWFHRDVIQATAQYNNQIPVLDNALRGKRPIIEFRGDMRLWNSGTQAKIPVNIVDTAATDAFSNINGTTGYSTDGYTFIQGSLVIFANDLDPEVRNRIYRVDFIDPNDSGTLIIDLVEVINSEALTGQTVVSLSGLTQQGISWWFDGDDWVQAQQKTSVNQAPLFDVYDADGVSLGNREKYISTTFEGSKLFGYALGDTQILDQELGFSLKFATISNVGDIVFENYFYNDTFLYVSNNASLTENISVGTPRQYIDRTAFSRLLGWQTAAAPARSRQVFRFTYSGEPLILDVPVDQTWQFAPIQVFSGTQFIDPTQYTYTVANGSTTITFVQPPALGTIIEVQAISNVASRVAYYQVPINLENNPFNENSPSFTLGSIRGHYQSICQNLRDLTGSIDGANNSRDLGDILRYGDNIVQHSSPLALAGPFLRDRQWEVVQAIQFNSREYEKYKARLLDTASRGNFVNNTATQVLDQVITEITLGRDNISPFYWTDMLPWGQTYVEEVYTFSPISTNVFDTQYLYDFTSSNFQGLSVYLNGTLLQRNTQYTVASDVKAVTVLVDLVIGDRIAIREYQTTYGSFVPNTPTKMGLYAAYRPEKFLDESLVTPALVIRGHDGSITRAFNDYRDDVLLEFENRIYNNLKIVSPVPLTAESVIPGQFRTTDYSLNEINTILSVDFLTWVGWNKLEYTAQRYDADDAFTYNYNQSSNKLTRQPLLGAWRGIYNYFYDTIYPTTRPWEMLGFSQEPSWWQDYYGPAPYTSGNLVLWEDLAQGLVRDPAGEYIRPEYARPDLLSVIPAGSEGELLPPLDSVVGNYSPTSFRRSWTFGDDGPTESAWRTSSSYPFAVMRLLALTRPAEFFSLFADRDLYVYDPNFAQFLWDQRYRLDGSRLAPIYGDGTSKASYINWIIDYNRQLGTNGTDRLETVLDNIGVRLCWRLAGFSDKKLLKIFTERSSPNSLNTSLMLPDESYQILLYKNQPLQRVAYSSVIVQIVADGYQVFGYNPTQPYFIINVSRVNGVTREISAGGVTARVPAQHTDNTVNVPYGYVFRNVNAVCDFLISYGVYLQKSGFAFETRENGYIMDWGQMAQEFLYWSNQGWTTGSITNLNPGAVQAKFTSPGAVVESLADPRPENLILNQNRLPIKPENLVYERIDNTITITTLSQDTISFLDVRTTAYESLVILDNVSVFADLIYQPVTGSRQYRVRAAGVISADWNGTVSAPGWVINQDNIGEWQPNQAYTKGQIVLFKNEFWTASTIIQPSEEFNYTLWIKSDYDQVQKGLLPNAPNSSDQLQQAYDVYTGNLENEVNLFSYGLIGFRPRQYMVDLNLDDASQVQLYQQFLGSKGTVQALRQLSRVNLDKEVAQYDIYEQWAVLRSQYGATANRNYFEIRLNQTLLRSNPSLVEIVQPGDASQADQTVLLQNLWKTSERFTTTQLLPLVYPVPNEKSLPTAGYVNIDDVDYTAFNIQDFASTAATLDQGIQTLGVGDYVWAAKINAYDWGVFRVDAVPGQVLEVSDNLDGRSLVTMNQKHGLAVDDYVIIRFFDVQIDGTYQVLSVPTLFTFTIALAFEGDQTQVTGEGVAFTLNTARVAQPCDINQLPYVNSLAARSRAWIDNNGLGQWEVLEKRDPFTPVDGLFRNAPETPSRYGAAITQGFQNLAAMVGAPGYLATAEDSSAKATGAVYTYVREADIDDYGPNLIIVPEVTDTGGFGSSMDMGNQTWAAVGAPSSRAGEGYVFVIYNPPGDNQFSQVQLLCIDPALTTADAEFGHSVTVSRDERWIYVGAPGTNQVYAYGRVDQQIQTVAYTGDGSTQLYNYADSIDVATGNQLTVVVENTVKVFGVDFSLLDDNINFNVAPADGDTIIITRRQSQQFLGTGTTQIFALDDLYLATSIASISVYVDNVLQRPKIDYDFVSNDLVFAIAPANNTDIRVVTGDYYQLVDTITVAGLPTGTRFGHSVSTTTDGRKLIVGAPFWGEADTTTVAAGNFIIGQEYQITFVGTTVWTNIGAASNTLGLIFTATGPGSGSGTAVRFIREGRSYVFDRSVQRFAVAVAAATSSYTPVRSLTVPGAPINVTLNGSFLLPTANNIGGQWSISGGSINLAVPVAAGDFVEVETNQFTLEQTLTDAIPDEDARFGWIVDQCINDCSLYTGAPWYGETIPEFGHVDYKINQSRVYGTTTNTVVNPTLTPGQYIRVNDQFIQLTAPATWTASQAWTIDTVVVSGSDLYRAVKAVPIGTAITDTSAWRPTNWPAKMAQDMRAAAVPNVVISLGDNLHYTGDNETTQFSTAGLYADAASYTVLVYVDNVVVTSPANYTYDATTQTIQFVTAPAGDSRIDIIGARLTVSVLNSASVLPNDKVRVSPGTGTLFADLGWNTYVDTQTITAPVIQDLAHFGSSLFISDSATELVIGAPQGDAVLPTEFDGGDTTFDARSCTFSDTIADSGVVYSYDFLRAANPSVSNPGQFVFGQQLTSSTLAALDQFGAALDYTTGTLLIGAPSTDLGDSASADFGSVTVFENLERRPTWTVLQQQTAVVDISMLNSVFIYDLARNDSKTFFDWFDPLQGKLLGAVQQNLDYTGATDPAAYNVGPINNYGQRWGQDRVGDIWFDTTRARWIDPNQDDIVYASRRWGQLFPGSTVDVYQWVASSVPPALYTGPGVVRDTISYSVTSSINEQGIFATTYYFWATGIVTVDRNSGKTLSVDTITRYIQEPKSSGIAYIAPVAANTVAIYNGLPYISVQDTVIHVEYDEVKNDAPVHVEYQLIAQDRPDAFLAPLLFRKLLDSFCGVDTAGNPVPDPFLPPSELYGVAFRPRQSMFVNRFLALQNYITEANAIMARVPIAEIRRFPMLDSAEPEPSSASGAWNKRVLDYTELTYQDLATVPLGYRYLVARDSTNNDRWTIYQVVAGTVPGSRALALVRVQTWDTRQYWQYADWYRPGYNQLGTIAAEVANFNDLAQLDLPTGSAVKVTGTSRWEIYQLTDGVWERVALQSGTIQISPEIWNYELGRFGFDVEVFDAQYFDQEPVTETRKILQSLNEEILIDDLAIERNRLLILMFNYILQEQQAPLWLTKTSLIDVDHVVRDLLPFQIYRRDNQDFVEDYITEVKPYHVQYRQFNLIYKAADQYDGTVTDFDLPAYWDSAQDLFVSPVLDDDTENPLSTTSSVPSTSSVWQTLPWSQWFQNYTLAISSITVDEQGTGYTVPPEVIAGEQWQPNTAYVAGDQVFWVDNLYTVTQAGITSTVEPRWTSGSRTNGTAVLAWAGRPATATAVITSAGQVVSITINDPGSGYIVTPQITLEGGNGTGAVAYPIMTGTGIGRDYTTVNQETDDIYYTLVRSFSTTIKFDRYQYQTQVLDWQPNTTYEDGTLVRFADAVWQAASPDSTAVNTSTWNPEDWLAVPASDLSGVDRTMGYYVPTVNQPGLDLALLITGVDYPGVQVDAPDFDQNTGFDVGNYDINPYDNIAYGPEGRPTYDPAILDAIYESEFTDPYLGTLPAPAYAGDPPNQETALVVSGGAFVDTYESHAPEELVPGIIYDTLDFRVYTTPGADWQGDGHGFAVADRSFTYDGVINTHSWAGLVEDAVSITLYDVTVGTRLLPAVDYTVDYPARTITIVGAIAAGTDIQITVYGVGGGNQLYKNTYLGTAVNAGIFIPMAASLITDFAIFVNSQPLSSGYSWAPYIQAPTWSLAASYTLNSIVRSGSVYYRAIQAVPPGTDITEVEYWNSYTPPYTWLTLTATYAASDLLEITALGATQFGSWSTPVTQYVVADGVNLNYALTNSLQGTNPANIIVEKNGIRARPAEGVEYIGDGSSVTYNLPMRGEYSLGTVNDSEVSVYVDNEPLTLTTEWVLDPLDGIYRTVTLTVPPSSGAMVLISVNTAADYIISGTNLLWRPTSSLVPLLGDVLAFTTFNDTSQQALLTQVFQGPTTSGLEVSEGYDDTLYDQATANDTPGSFDFATGTIIALNEFDTGREIVNPDRLFVSLNGFYLHFGTDFEVEGSKVVIPGPVISANDVVAITSMTQSTVPAAEAFRIFQDMRGLQLTYRISAGWTTALREDLSSTADVIEVVDASRLAEPNLPAGIFGQITINGERITYRERDIVANTVSGLRRGVAGTGAADHQIGSAVYDIGLGNLLPAQYQDRVLAANALANGSQTVFTAADITLIDLTPAQLDRAVQVYVGGLLQVDGYSVTSSGPVTVAFDTAPTAGYQVSIRVRQGLSWYEPGPTTASNGEPLQITNTAAAVFIRAD